MLQEEDKQKYIASISFFTSCLIIIFLVTLIHIFVEDKLDIEYILSNFAVPIEDFVAETAEKMSYIVSIICFPITFFLSYLFFKSHIKVFTEKKLKFVIGLEIVLGIIIVFLSTMFSDFTKYIYFPTFPSIIIPLIVLLFSYVALIYYTKQQKSKPSMFCSLISTIIYSAIIFSLYQIFILYNTPSYTLFHFDLHHFEAYFYPIYKTISGMTPGIDFRNLYGFYPYIYSLFFNFNNISIQGISLFNTILVILILTTLAYILFSNIKNKVIAFLTFNVCLYYSFLVNLRVIPGFGCYCLQNFPHRVFFCMITGAFITAYINLNNEKVKKILEYIGYIISSVAMFWNFESGIVALAGWSSLHFYLSLNSPHRIKLIAKVFLKTIISILCTFFTIFIVTYIHSSAIINPLGLFFGQFIFYNKGFAMLKMNILEQPFLLVLIVYLISIADSIKAVIEKNISKQDSLKFTFSIIGFGLFTYFQGRSHILCLTACSWPMLILSGILTENYYKKFTQYKDLKNTSPLSIFLKEINFSKFFILFTVFTFVATNNFLYLIYFPQYIRKAAINAESEFYNTKLFLLRKDEQYDILTENASYYYTKLKHPNLLPFSDLIDCFFKKDFDNIYKYLKTSNNKLVVDNYTKSRLEEEYIDQNYILEKQNNGIFIYKRKK